jgi:hypothetical protein
MVTVKASHSYQVMTRPVYVVIITRSEAVPFFAELPGSPPAFLGREGQVGMGFGGLASGGVGSRMTFSYGNVVRRKRVARSWLRCRYRLGV